MFELDTVLGELRCWPTERLDARRGGLGGVRRGGRGGGVGGVRVLDERGAVDDTVAAGDGVSTRTVRESVETARALESLPEVAAAAHAGRLSGEQLGAVARLADEGTDAEWARRAPHVAPADLARLARAKEKPTAEDAARLREARHLRIWWRHDTGMLHLAGALPDLAGARFEATIQAMVQQLRPCPGRPWDSWEHRAADALVALADEHAARPVDGPVTVAAPVTLVVEVPWEGPATVAGIPLPDSMVAS